MGINWVGTLLSHRKTEGIVRSSILSTETQFKETTEKEVQDTACRGIWGCPPDIIKSPKIGGLGGGLRLLQLFPEVQIC
jgi:hypothetical protein